MTLAQVDEVIAATCAARAICGAHNRLCAPTCVAYTELADQFRLSGIPRRYHDIGGNPASAGEVSRLIRAENQSVAAFLAGWGGDIGEHIAAGRGLYLFGKITGTGKTTAATALAADYIRNCVSGALAERRAVGRQLVQFVHVPSFLRTAKAIYENDDEVARGASGVVAEMTRRMTSVPLVIFDDIGAEKPTESIRERLLTILDARWAQPLSTIYTSNLPLNELEMALGSRIRSRIEGATTTVAFGGADKRRKAVSA